MSTETDDLWRYIHGVVNERVPPEHRAAVTELVAKTTVHILTTPEFLFGLRIVQDLRFENETLRRAVVSLQAAQAAPRPRARKSPAKKAAPRKKAAAKKAAPVRKAPVRKVTAAQKRAFKKGAKGR